jgi:tetratricopeptide (TPR) repeat protein
MGPDDEGDTAEEGPPAQPTADAEDRAEKLQEYLEHLEVLDNPIVSELTMLGEMAFDANQAEDAYEHYLEVIENHTDDPMAPFALYKLAWAEYNLGDVEASIDDMELVMEWIGDGPRDGQNPMLDALESEGPANLDLFRSQAP